MTAPNSSTTRYCRQPDFLTTDLGSGVAVLDLAKSSYLGFNPTAAAVWTLLETPHSLDGIVDALLAKFDVAPQRCRDEVSALLSRLMADGLIYADSDGVE